MSSLLKYLGLVLLTTAFSLCGCRSSVLHKDGFKEAVTEPIISTIEKEADKLQLEKLVNSTDETVKKLGQLVDTTKDTAQVSQDTMKKLADSLTELTQLLTKLQSTTEASTDTVKTVNRLLEDTRQLLPELNKISQNVNGILPEVKDAVANIKEITSNLKDLTAELSTTVKSISADIKEQTKESIIWKILPSAVIAFALLIAVLIIASALKKKYDTTKPHSNN